MNLQKDHPRIAAAVEAISESSYLTEASWSDIKPLIEQLIDTCRVEFSDPLNLWQSDLTPEQRARRVMIRLLQSDDPEDWKWAGLIGAVLANIHLNGASSSTNG